MKKNIFALIGITIAYIVIYLLNLKYVLTLDNINVIYEGVINGDEEIAKKLYDSLNSSMLLGIIITSLTVLGKVFLIALIIYIGYYLVEKQNYKDILSSVIVAEVVNLITALVKNINLAFINPPSTYIDTTLTPFSLVSFFDPQKLDQWLLIPLSAVNIFEVIYILLLSYMLSKNLKRSFGNSCQMVLLSYGLVLVLFIVCTSFYALYATE
ncbi:MAG: hypothetical protein MJ211_05115 [Bacteroidales bacterium]|nr:hypothetical protein [Bacteroidales bacterium]